MIRRERSEHSRSIPQRSEAGAPAKREPIEQREPKLQRDSLKRIAERAAWSDDEPSHEREPQGLRDPRPPARFYAPHGECTFCDARRAAAAKSMRAVRERGGG